MKMRLDRSNDKKEAYAKVLKRELGLKTNGKLRLSRNFQGVESEFDVEFGIRA